MHLNHTPGVGVKDVAEDACDALAADDHDLCTGAVLEQLLQHELSYYNARDGKNLSWLQRPPRFLSDNTAAEYTVSVAEVLDVYRDDSQTQYYRPYDAAAIDVLVSRASSRLPGTNYPDIDALLYGALSKGDLDGMRGAHVAVMGSVMPW